MLALALVGPLTDTTENLTVVEESLARVEIVVLASDVLDLPATSTPVRFGRDHDWR